MIMEGGKQEKQTHIALKAKTIKKYHIYSLLKLQNIR